MKLDRLIYDPASLVNFYEDGFAALGALCERTWHDRLEIVAEGEDSDLERFLKSLDIKNTMIEVMNIQEEFFI